MLSSLVERRYPITLDTYHTFDLAPDHRLPTLVALNVVHGIAYKPLIPILIYLSAISCSLSELVDAPLRSHPPPDPSCWFVDEQARSRTIRLRCSFSSCFLGALHTSLHKRPSGCADKAKCRAGYLMWIERTLKEFISDVNAVDVLRESKSGVKRSAFCEVCREKAGVQVKALQAEAWGTLPAYVGTRPWEELLREMGLEQEKEPDFEVDELRDGKPSLQYRLSGAVSHVTSSDDP
ncbi:hypothetical protein BDV98DRAFT_572667 [Pterulicium gracile]|uniref:Uncharacterized protein n=1 Tax=Pterulicium gracile TaxID=1884261 RepID=A0A5C3QDC2_9AGAR|nr:hypothetical protein BDV98DRAFT_572667 [Pterula gracilis]